MASLRDIADVMNALLYLLVFSVVLYILFKLKKTYDLGLGGGKSPAERLARSYGYLYSEQLASLTSPYNDSWAASVVRGALPGLEVAYWIRKEADFWKRVRMIKPKFERERRLPVAGSRLGIWG